MNAIGVLCVASPNSPLSHVLRPQIPLTKLGLRKKLMAKFRFPAAVKQVRPSPYTACSPVHGRAQSQNSVDHEDLSESEVIPDEPGPSFRSCECVRAGRCRVAAGIGGYVVSGRQRCQLRVGR
jgi:hypothetical protein